MKPEEVTVRVMEVVALSVPEAPVMVIGYAPGTVDDATAKVATLEVVDEDGLNEAVTPVGMPDAAKVTLPANGLTSAIVMVSVPLAPAVTEIAVAEGASVKPPAAGTLSVMEVFATRVPEVPVIVIGYVPGAVDDATATVATVEVVDEVGLNVTPEGRPEAENVTLPVNGLISVTLIVSVPLAPGAIDRAVADALSAKPPAAGTVSVIVVVAGVSEPEVPVMVIG